MESPGKAEIGSKPILSIARARNEMSSTVRNCTSCGRSIQWDANVCPYCGHDYRLGAYPYQAQGPSISSGMRVLLYILSFFIPIVGIIAGLVLLVTSKDEDGRHVGKMCILIAMLPLIIIIACWLFAGLLMVSFL